MISIIVPLYNTSLEIFEETLESLRNQTNNNYELIIVDDGSNINYEDLLKKYSDLNIKYIKTGNYGVSHARNLGIELSSLEYILFLDSDDTLESNAINVFSKYNNVDIVISSNKINTNGIIEILNQHDEKVILDKDKLLKSVLINDYEYRFVDTPWNKLYRKDFLLENNLLFDEELRYGEDGLFNYYAYLNAKKILLIDDFTYVYRVNEDSLCSSFHHDFADNTLKLLTKYIDLYENGLLEYDVLCNFVSRNITRLFRKHYVFYGNEDLKKELENLLEYKQLLAYLKNAETNDKNKRELVRLLSDSDIDGLSVYVEDICKKKLLKK